jgi:acyl-CoA thioesterase-1
MIRSMLVLLVAATASLGAASVDALAPPRVGAASADTSLSRVADPVGPRVVCLGDSLTEGFNLPPENAYPALVEQRLRGAGWPNIQVVNAGISGATSASAVSRLKWQLRVKPHVLVLALGANDGLRGVDLDSTRANLSSAIDLALENEIVVLLAGMKLPPNYGPDYTKQFEGIFTELAREKGVALIPFLLDGVAADPALNLPDGIHPNAQGYEVVARTVVDGLTPLLHALAAPGDGDVPGGEAGPASEAASLLQGAQTDISPLVVGGSL